VRTILLPDSSPLVTLRLVFRTGAASDPPGKPGLAWLTAQMLSGGGTRRMEYAEILNAFFPMASDVSVWVDKEMTSFTAETHRENLDEFYTIFRDMLLDPGWREEDFSRLRDDAVNYLAVALRGQNDEELAKELLYQEIYRHHCYGWHNAGTVSSLQGLTMEDVRGFYGQQFASGNLTLGLAGGYPEGFAQRVIADFHAVLPARAPAAPALNQPKQTPVNTVLIAEKPARSVAISLGFPMDVRRGHSDYPALLVAQSCLGQHRMSSGRLFTRMRQLRGLNYGDYAYIEYFPGGMYTLEPAPNLARSHQIFQLWIRPVEVDVAVFSLRLALHELEKMIRDGPTEEEFQRTRSFLSKYVNLLLKTKAVELGYAADSEFYGIPNYADYVRSELVHLTREKVSAAIQRHWRMDGLSIVMVGPDAGRLRTQLLSSEPTPMTYNSPKPEEILAEDRIVARRDLNVAEDGIRVMPAEQAFA